MTYNAIYAQNNWWGTTNSNNFKIAGTGSVICGAYRDSSISIPLPPLNKTGGILVASGGSDIPMRSTLDTAYQLVAANRLKEARDVCLNLINNYPDYTVSYNALNLLKDTYSLGELSSTKDVYLSLFNTKAKNNLYAMAGLILADVDKQNALTLIDNVINKYKNESIVELALYDKFVCYYFEKQDMANALAVSKQLDDLFPSSQGAIEAHRVLEGAVGVNKNQNQKTIVDQTVSEYSLLGNYPNPFNPTTELRFALPEAANVSLIIYDVLGREVSVLATGQYEAGYHSVTWSGSAVASGVYFARLEVHNQIGQLRYNKVNKLLLVK